MIRQRWSSEDLALFDLLRLFVASAHLVAFLSANANNLLEQDWPGRYLN